MSSNVGIHSDSSLVSSYPSQIALYRILHAHQQSILESTIQEISYSGIFRFPINYNWSGGWLYFLGEGVGHGRFEHGHMENWVNRVHGLWKMESE